MADSVINVSGYDAAYPIDTRTIEGGDHRQVVVIGDPTTSANVATVNSNGTLNVSASDLDIRNLSSGSDSVAAVQSGAWNIGTVNSITTVVPINDNGGSITVDGIVSAIPSGTYTVQATDLDIRALDSATDSVNVGNFPATQGVSGSVNAVQSGVWDIGTVASITSVVSVNDNGGSLTVDGIVSAIPSGTYTVQATDLDIRNLVSGTDSIDIGNFPATQGVSGSVNAVQSGTWDIGTVNSITTVVPINDNGGSLTIDGVVSAIPSGTYTVQATDLDIRNLASGTDTIDAYVSNNVSAQANGLVASALPTEILHGSQAPIMVDGFGRLITRDTFRELLSVTGVSLTTTGDATIVAAGGANIYRDLSQIVMSNSSASGVLVTIKDNGTAKLNIYLAANGGGAVIPFHPSFKQDTANTAWTGTLSSAVSTVYITSIYLDEK